MINTRKALQIEREVTEMATSTFGKQFSVKPDKAQEFIKEMTKNVKPTLKRDFVSRFAHAKDMKKDIMNALGK